MILGGLSAGWTLPELALTLIGATAATHHDHVAHGHAAGHGFVGDEEQRRREAGGEDEILPEVKHRQGVLSAQRGVLVGLQP